jgi:hypothetical protein
VQLDQPDGLYRVRFEKIDIFEPAHDPQLGSSRERALQLARELNRLLDDGVELYEVQLTPDRQGVIVRGQLLVQVTESDAQLAGRSIEEVAAQVREALRRLVWSESIRLMF